MGTKVGLSGIFPSIYKTFDDLKRGSWCLTKNLLWHSSILGCPGQLLQFRLLKPLSKAQEPFYLILRLNLRFSFHKNGSFANIGLLIRVRHGSGFYLVPVVQNKPVFLGSLRNNKIVRINRNIYLILKNCKPFHRIKIVRY